MDSKSISREGVGVRLPSLAPDALAVAARAEELHRVARELAGFLLPELRSGFRSATQELGAELFALRAGGARPVDERSFGRQEELHERVRRAGWCLGILAAAQGPDVLGTRVEAEGLRWMLGALVDAGAFELVPSAVRLPRLDAGSAGAFELPLLAGWCALRARRPGRTVHWSSHGSGLSFADIGPDAELAARCERLNSAPGGRPRLILERDRLVLRWLEEGGRGGPGEVQVVPDQQ